METGKQKQGSAMFAVRLGLFVVITGAAGAAAFVTAGWGRVPGQVVLGIMFAHALELQHQSLHGTGLATARGNRWVGRLLGLPMLVSYSHYRVRHLRHHRYLGTDRDTEFFQYDAVEALTPVALLASAFNIRRYGTFARNLISAVRRRRLEAWTSAEEERTLRAEYVGLALAVAAVVAASVATGTVWAVVLWAVPLIAAEPAHFFIELPEHIGCDTTSRDPLRNTRTIVGSRFSYWLTNGNNFHVEHHYKQHLPISELPVVHQEIVEKIEVLVPTYWAFYRQVLAAAVGSRRAAGSVESRSGKSIASSPNEVRITVDVADATVPPSPSVATHLSTASATSTR